MFKVDKYSNKNQVCNKDLINEFLINGNYYKPFNTFYHNLQDSSRLNKYVRQNNSEQQGIKFSGNQNQSQPFQPFISERDKQGQLLQNNNEDNVPQKIRQFNYQNTPSQEDVENIISELKKSKNNNCMFQTKLKQFLSLMHKIQQEKAVVQDISPSKSRNPIIPEILKNKNLTFQQSPSYKLVKTPGELFQNETPKINRQQLLTFHASQTTNSTEMVNSSGAIINSTVGLIHNSKGRVNTYVPQSKYNIMQSNSSEHGAYQRFITKLESDTLKTDKQYDLRQSKIKFEINFEEKSKIETSFEQKNDIPEQVGNFNLGNYFQKKKLNKNYRNLNQKFLQQQNQEYYKDEQLTNNITISQSKLSQSLKNLTKFPFEINDSTKNNSNIYDHVNCPKFQPLTVKNQQNYIDILEHQKNSIPSIGFYDPQFLFVKQKSPSYLFLKSNKTPQNAQTFHISPNEQQNQKQFYNLKNNKSPYNNTSVQESNNEEEKETFEKFYGKMMKEVKNEIKTDIIKNYGKKIHPSGNLVLKNVYNSHKDLVDADQALKKKIQSAKKLFVDLKSNHKNNVLLHI